ncbi:MAG: NlpC/P60 family protein [Bacteroidia bacterium]|nr:NlpC/P60 family protein [Bacteroidia bacterium]
MEQENIHHKKNDIELLLEENKLRDCLQIIENLNLTTNQRNELFLIKNRLSKLDQEKTKGIISHEQADLEHNKIISALQKFISSLESEKKISLKKNQNTLIIGLIIMFLIFLIVQLQFFNKSYVTGNKELEFKLNYIDGEVGANPEAMVQIFQVGGLELETIYFQLNNKTILDYEKNPSCNCWIVDLRKYGLPNGMYQYRISKSHSSLQQDGRFYENFLRVDNSIPEIRFKAMSIQGKDSLIMMVGTKANREIEYDIDLPFARNQINSNEIIYNDSSGFYRFKRVTIPQSIIESTRNEDIIIRIKEKGREKLEFNFTVDDILDGKEKFVKTGEYTTQFFFDGDGLPNQLVENGLILNLNGRKERKQSTVRKNDTTELSFWISFYSSESIELKWEINNSNLPREELSVSLTKAVTKGIYKDTFYSLPPISNLTGNSYLDTAINSGLIYEYSLQVKDKSGNILINSEPIDRLALDINPLNLPNENPLFIDTIFNNFQKPNTNIQPILADSFRSSIEIGNEIVSVAKSYYGSPYCWGGTGPCFDCSGFTKRVFSEVGIVIPRNSINQYSFYKGYKIVGKQNLEKLLPGDLVFFDCPGYNHIGIVVSNNHGRVQFIHSTNGNNGVAYNFIEAYWFNMYVGARRLSEEKDLNFTFSPKPKSVPKIDSSNQVRNSIPKASIRGHYPEGSIRRLSYKDLGKYTPCELKIMKCEIFARHGYKFHLNPCMVDLFNSADYFWYTKIPGNDNAEWYFSDIERANVDLLIKNEGTCDCKD